MSKSSSCTQTPQQLLDASRDHPLNTCFVCSSNTDFGWRLKLVAEGEDITTEIFVPSKFQGYSDVVHGGVALTILDEIMAYAAFVTEGHHVVTQRLRVTFLLPLKTETLYKAVAKTTRQHSTDYMVTGEILDQEGNLFISASGVFKEIQKTHEQ